MLRNKDPDQREGSSSGPLPLEALYPADDATLATPMLMSHTFFRPSVRRRMHPAASNTTTCTRCMHLCSARPQPRQLTFSQMPHFSTHFQSSIQSSTCCFISLHQLFTAT
ncbi:hypothetical protein IG631_06217 [Alternaria alternata]|nr:hypothetical protein IG631_06217 [Alternaria alternata]